MALTTTKGTAGAAGAGAAAPRQVVAAVVAAAAAERPRTEAGVALTPEAAAMAAVVGEETDLARFLRRCKMQSNRWRKLWVTCGTVGVAGGTRVCTVFERRCEYI